MVRVAYEIAVGPGRIKRHTTESAFAVLALDGSMFGRAGEVVFPGHDCLSARERLMKFV